VFPERPHIICRMSITISGPIRPWSTGCGSPKWLAASHPGRVPRLGKHLNKWRRPEVAPCSALFGAPGSATTSPVHRAFHLAFGNRAS